MGGTNSSQQKSDNSAPDSNRAKSSPLNKYLVASVAQPERSPFHWRPYCGIPVPQTEEELAVICNEKALAAVDFSQHDCLGRNFAKVQEWVNQHPERINYFLLPISHGFEAAHTALHYMCQSPYPETDRAISFLLSRGADPNLMIRQTKRGSQISSCLSLASSTNYWNICEILLTYGANIPAELHSYCTALNAVRFEIWEGASECIRAKCAMLMCANAMEPVCIDGTSVGTAFDTNNLIASLPREILFRVLSMLSRVPHHIPNDDTDSETNIMAVFGWIGGICKNERPEIKAVYNYLTAFVKANSDVDTFEDGTWTAKPIRKKIAIPPVTPDGKWMKMHSTWKNSMNRYVNDEWNLELPDRTEVNFSINTEWSRSVKLEGHKNLVRFCKSLGFVGELLPILVICIFAFSRHFNCRVRRMEMMFPSDLAFQSGRASVTWEPVTSVLPDWYLKVANAWFEGKIIHPTFDFSQGSISEL